MANRFWVGGTGTWDASSTANWSTSTGGASGASAPVSVDNVFFDANSGTGTCTTAAGSTCNVLNAGSSTVTLVLGANHTCVGAIGFTLGSINLNNFIMTCASVNSSNSNVRSINFGTSGKIILTGNSATIWNFNNSTNFSVSGTSFVEANYSGSTGTRVFRPGAAGGGSESNAVNLYITNGSDGVSVGNGGAYVKDLNFTGFSGNFTNEVRYILGNLTISSGMTLSSGTAITVFAGTSGTQAITSNGKTLDFPLTFAGVGGTFAFQDALTQGSTRAFTVTNGTVQLKNGVTSTVGSFVASNSAQKFLQSTLAGSQATLSQASGTINVADLNIRDINATGGAFWNAYTDFENTDAGNNDGWNFGLSPPYASYEPPIIIRSFTQPRRF
jgi:hypothetical protein